MGINNLADIFKENYYKNLEGGILEALGILFKENIRIYAYPIEREFFDRYREQFGRGDNVKLASLEGSIVNVENLVVAENLRNLYKYVRENGFLECVNQFDRENMRSLHEAYSTKSCKEKMDGKTNYPLAYQI